MLIKKKSNTLTRTGLKKIKFINSRKTKKVGFAKIGNTNIRHGISKAETVWLDKLSIPERSKVIYGFHGKIIIVDGFNARTKTVYEYLGGKWHGSHMLPCNNRDLPDPWLKKSPNQLYEETRTRFQFLFNLGYKVFFVWDFQDKKGIRGRYYSGIHDTLY